MSLDLTQQYTDTDWVLSQHGETVSVYRLLLSYTTVPPTETWASATTATIEIQPMGGNMPRHDAGLAAGATHFGFADYDSAIVQNDRIMRTGDTNYYLVLDSKNYEDHLELYMKYCKGAV